jgi:hypothetical protein
LLFEDLVFSLAVKKLKIVRKMPLRYLRHSHKLARQEEESAVSVAEAYPPVLVLGNDEENVIPTKVEEETPLFFVPAEEQPNEEPAQLPAEETVPTMPEEPVQNDKSEEPKPTKRMLKGKKPKPTPAAEMSGAFFPVNFGSSDGGSIAISNSYSTGRKGSSKSQATSYGVPVVTAY